MEISRTAFDDLLDRLRDCWNIPEFEVRENYSGRYMYDKVCIGFVSNNVLFIHGALTAILAEIERDADNEGEDYTQPSWYDFQPVTDSMGLESIVYYPNITVVDA